MRAGIVVNVRRADRLRLEAIVADRSAPQKHVWRANVILATADGCGTAEIMRRSGKSKPVVWTWQARFMAEGVEELLRDKTGKPGFGTTHPRSSATRAAPYPDVQTVEGPGVCREAQGHRRSLCRSSRPRRRPLG